MPTIGAPELIVILVIVLLVFGPGRLPDVGNAIGKGIREFRKASTEIEDSVRGESKASAPPAAPAAPDAPDTSTKS